MKKSTKALLWSALVFPGAGHIYLKRYSRGALLVAVTGSLLYFIVSAVLRIAFDIAAKIQSGAMPPTVDAINKALSQQTSGAQQWMNIASMGLVVLWVIGMVDAYRCARAQERSSPGAREDRK